MRREKQSTAHTKNDLCKLVASNHMYVPLPTAGSGRMSKGSGNRSSRRAPALGLARGRTLLWQTPFLEHDICHLGIVGHLMSFSTPEASLRCLQQITMMAVHRVLKFPNMCLQPKNESTPAKSLRGVSKQSQMTALFEARKPASLSPQKGPLVLTTRPH